MTRVKHCAPGFQQRQPIRRIRAIWLLDQFPIDRPPRLPAVATDASDASERAQRLWPDTGYRSAGRGSFTTSTQ
jgi:hypothetical protein